MAIRVTEVSRYYGAQAALDKVSFEVTGTGVVGLLGRNGAGKSTMMKILTCYMPPSEGRVEVAGYDVFEHSVNIRSLVGYLPESNPLYPEMYVREYLRYVAGIYRVAHKKDRVEEMIALTGLQREQRKKIGQLSKGYRQRVGLAQALIHDPQLLILDEPTTGLDPSQLEEIRALITRLGRSKTILLSSHNLQDVQAVCQRVIIIDQGVVIRDADMQSLQRESTSADGASLVLQKIFSELSKT